jgi:hypothetical protein
MEAVDAPSGATEVKQKKASVERNSLPHRSDARARVRGSSRVRAFEMVRIAVRDFPPPRWVVASPEGLSAPAAEGERSFVRSPKSGEGVGREVRCGARISKNSEEFD